MGIGKGADRHRNGPPFIAPFGVEQGCSADRAETEDELGPLIALRTYSLAVPVTVYGGVKEAIAANTLPVRC